MNSDGSGQVNLTHNAALDWTPSWSPDGAKILFTSYRAGGGELFAMNADGSGVTQLTHNSLYDRHPKWSPDGTQIAYESYVGGNWEIMLMRADGSRARQLTHKPADDFEPDWSPDSKMIAWRTGRVRRGGRHRRDDPERTPRRRPHQGSGVRPSAGLGTRRLEDRLRERAERQLPHQGHEA
jgi:Tol biopolymer transport system component